MWLRVGGVALPRQELVTMRGASKMSSGIPLPWRSGGRGSVGGRGRPAEEELGAFLGEVVAVVLHEAVIFLPATRTSRMKFWTKHR